MAGRQLKLTNIQAVLKVWHLIIGGIEKLDFEADPQLNKIFNDLVVKWLPQFKWVCIFLLAFYQVPVYL